MKFEEVQALLDKGFSAQFIMNLSNTPTPEPAPAEQTPAASAPDQAAQPAPNQAEQAAPAGDQVPGKLEQRMTALENAIDKLVSGMQASAILTSNQPAQAPVVPIEEQIGELIAPSKQPTSY